MGSPMRAPVDGTSRGVKLAPPNPQPDERFQPRTPRNRDIAALTPLASAANARFERSGTQSNTEAVLLVEAQTNEPPPNVRDPYSPGSRPFSWSRRNASQHCSVDRLRRVMSFMRRACAADELHSIERMEATARASSLADALRSPINESAVRRCSRAREHEGIPLTSFLYDRDTRIVSLRFATAWLQRSSEEDIARWLDASTYEQRTESDVTIVELSLDEWERLGRVPEAQAEPEEIDAWLFAHDAMARVVGARPQIVSVRSIGHVGADAFALDVRVDGERVDLSTNGPIATAGSTEALLPATYVVVSQCRTFMAHPRARATQLAFVGRLQDVAARLRDVFDGSKTRVDVELDEHLGSLLFERVEKASLAWNVAGRRGEIYDLGVEYQRADGTFVQVPVAAVDPNAPVASTSGHDHLLLAEDVAIVARTAKGQRNKLRRYVADVLHDPKRLLPEGNTYENIDFSRYSPRVAGFVPVIRADRPADIRSSGVQWYTRDEDPSIPFLRIEVAQPDGTVATLAFDSPEDARKFVADAESASEGTVLNRNGVDVFPTKPLVDRVREDLALYERHDPNKAVPNASADAEGASEDPERAPPAARYAAVIREVDEPTPLAPAVAAGIDESRVPWDVLDSLFAPGVALKPHQRQGVAWLWNHYQAERHGVLLADDMGLGKTLQVAAFLALMRRLGKEADRTKPSLIVAPVILLENWKREAQKFFKPEVFESLLVLHDRGLRQRVETSRLDVTGLSSYAFILTNYDTLARFQQQLLTVDFAAAVLDEAQAVKNPEALRTLAARGLKRTFAVCATGTPVENRLLDLWTLYDVLSPGQPFGSRADFERSYEDEPDAATKLRAALLLPSPQSTLLRRTKAEALNSLPAKYEKVHLVPMTQEQLAQERIVARGPSGKRVLEILHHLQKLYQHPRLLMRAEEAEQRSWSPREIIDQSPKLAKVIELLKEIRERGEKALVFTLWTAMQDLLARVLRSELGLDRIRILNGAANQQKRAQQYLDEFERKSGFDVLILSPLAAGTGLTITAANHVIHYGRWWNPAKEDQATDRAYRIGQTKPVYVHYPILHHPHSEASGFDVKLHTLVDRKRNMARDFLDPALHQELTEGELSAAFAEET